jgi:hypothetical protein
MKVHDHQTIQNFTLIGYDCPLVIYPAPVVPIVTDIYGNYKAVYLDDANGNIRVQTEPVDRNSTFTKLSELSEGTINSLKKFDCQQHRLFAIAENNVCFYEVNNQSKFFCDLLKDRNFTNDRPFVRIDLAKATKNRKLICKELSDGKKHIVRYKPFLLPLWEKEKKEIEQNYPPMILLIGKESQKSNIKLPDEHLKKTRTDQRCVFSLILSSYPQLPSTNI